MLVITRREGEEVIVGDPANPLGVVRVATVKGDRVRLAFSFPREVEVHRREVAEQILQALKPDTEVVGIDEVQFLGMEAINVVEALAAKGLRVICAGLDQDYQGKPFEPMPQLLAIAEYITKTLAICMVCGNPANHTQRLVASEDRVLLGAQGTYEARCRRCFDPTLATAAPAAGNPNSQVPTPKR